MMIKGITQSSSAQQELVLESVFNNQNALASLIIIQDCPSQSGLPILLQLIQQSALNISNKQKQEDVLLIKTKSDLLLDHFKKIQSNLKDGSSFESIDVAQLVHRNTNHDEQKPDKFNNTSHLLQLVREAIKISPVDAASTTTFKSEKPLSILVDTVQELFRIFSVHSTFQFLKDLLNLLPNSNSRLIILDSPHLNLQVDNDCLDKMVDPSVGLRSLALSTSHLHLRIHPTSLLDNLINDFGLTVPMQSTKQMGTHYDLRLFQLIEELASNCDPYFIGNSTSNKEGLTIKKSIPQALLIPTNINSSSSSSSRVQMTNNHQYHLGTCVIEWTAKNLKSCAIRTSTSIKSFNNIKDKKKSLNKNKASANLSSVQHGLEALKLSIDGSLPPARFTLIPILLSQVIKKRSFKLSMPIGDQVKKTQSDSSLDPLQSQLTFNLSLTEKQKLDREAVQLPFLPKRSKDGTVIEAPGEMYDGSFQKNASNRANRGIILYEPDSADDFDDEEPDDD